MTPKSLLSSLALAATVFATSLAQANICIDRDAETREMTVKIYENCVSSSYSPRPHTFKVDVDESAATIKITGSFQRDASSVLVLTDCGGAQSLDVSFPDIDLRRYKITRDQKLVGAANFLDNTGDICALQEQQNWKSDEVVALEWDWLDTPAFERSATLADLIEQVTDAFPATPFGRPSVTIKLETHGRYSRQKGVLLDVTAYGPLGENLDGQRTVITAIRRWNGWDIDEARRRYVCSSGPNAGQWTHEDC